MIAGGNTDVSVLFYRGEILFQIAEKRLRFSQSFPAEKTVPVPAERVRARFAAEEPGIPLIVAVRKEIHVKALPADGLVRLAPFGDEEGVRKALPHLCEDILPDFRRTRAVVVLDHDARHIHAETRRPQFQIKGDDLYDLLPHLFAGVRGIVKLPGILCVRKPEVERGLTVKRVQ